MSPAPIDEARRREQHEPEELRNPVPVPLLLTFLAVITWGSVYYFRDLASATGAGSEAGDRRSVVVVDPSAKVDGAAVYAGNCAACHQAAGGGVPGVFPPLVASEWVVGDAGLPIRILLHGLNGPLKVAGQDYAGMMPAFGRLADAELAAVISYLRKSWGNAAAEVTTADVAAVRQQYGDRSEPWTADALTAAVAAP